MQQTNWPETHINKPCNQDTYQGDTKSCYTSTMNQSPPNTKQKWAAHTLEIWEYYQNKYNRSNTTLVTLDWDAYNKAMRRLSTKAQWTIHKYTHNWLPTGNHMHKRYHV